jgi:hypothetical protein
MESVDVQAGPDEIQKVDTNLGATVTGANGGEDDFLDNPHSATALSAFGSRVPYIVGYSFPFSHLVQVSSRSYRWTLDAMTHLNHGLSKK